MWQTIKGWFGCAEHEMSDILADFHAAIGKIEALVTRKKDIATKKAAEAAKAEAAAALAQLHADEASVIRQKLKDLVSGSPATPAAAV